jgi:hypothetical protein
MECGRQARFLQFDESMDESINKAADGAIPQRILMRKGLYADYRKVTAAMVTYWIKH